MVSSMYLGDIVRRVIRAMAEDSDLFGGGDAPNLSEPFILRSLFFCIIFCLFSLGLKLSKYQFSFSLGS